MATSEKEVKIFDLDNELTRLSTHLYRSMGIPRAIFESDPILRMKSKFSFPCVEPEDLYFSNFYGDTKIVTLNEYWRKLAVKSKARRRPPSDVPSDLIRDKIAECVDSVNDADREHATLKVIVGKLYFEGHKRVSNEDQQQFFEGKVSGNQNEVKLSRSKIKFYQEGCEWTSPNQTLQFLAENGFSISSREPLPAKLSLRLRGSRFKISVGNGEYLYVGNALTLNPTTLATENWRLQTWYPLTHHIMHGFPSSNDVFVCSNVRRYADVAELLAMTDERMPGLKATIDDPDSFIRRTDVGFALVNQCNDLKYIREYDAGERIHLQYQNVSCFIDVQPWRFFKVDPQTNEFFQAHDKCGCDSFITFPFSQDRVELIEAITRLSLALFPKTNDDAKLPLTLVSQFASESDGTGVSWSDVQAIIRLRDKWGDLFQLLGLGDDPSREEYKQKAIALEGLLTRNRQQQWFKKMKMNFIELRDKLHCACLAYDIDLNVCSESE